MKQIFKLGFTFPISNIQDMRKIHKDAFLKKHNIKLGFMSAFVKAAAHALTDQPAVNAGMTTHHQRFFITFPFDLVLCVEDIAKHCLNIFHRSY